MSRFVWLALVLIAIGCGGSVADAETDGTCNVMETLPSGKDHAPGTEFWFFDHGLAGPDRAPGDCADLGNGWLECGPDACLVSPYPGTCPHCGGGAK